MKPIIDYHSQTRQMGDLLRAMGVSMREDFSADEQKKLREYLEKYMSGKYDNILTKIDLKKFFLVIKGSDEADNLYQYVK